MDILAALRNNDLTLFKHGFVWTSTNGRRLTMDEMDSVHMLNAANQIMRRLSDRHPHYDERNPEPRFFLRGANGSYISNNAAGSQPQVNQLFYFCWELERRNNFERNGDRVRFLNMMRTLFDRQFIERDLPQAIRGFGTAVSPAIPQQERRNNPLLIIQAQPLDYRPAPTPTPSNGRPVNNSPPERRHNIFDWIAGEDSPKKKDKKTKAHEKQKAEQAAELAAKHEQALISGGKRKIQAD